MSCSTLCGCMAPVGVMIQQKVQVLDPCWSSSIFNKNTSGELFVPLSGYYQLFLSANGGNINNALDIEQGTLFLIAKLSSNTPYNFTLGDTSTFIGGLYNVSVKSPTNRQNYTAGLQLQYIGVDQQFEKALTTSSESTLQCQEIDWQAQLYSDGTSPFTMIDKAIIPQEDFCHSPLGRENWYIADITLPKTGNYTFYVYGDDVGQLILNGSPLIWGRADRPNSLNRTMSYENNGNYNSIGGHATVHLNAGEHQVIIWNKNTGGGPSLAFCSIKDSDKNEYLDFNRIRILDKSLGCNNSLVVPSLNTDNNNSNSFNVLQAGTRYYLLSQYANTQQ